LGTERRAVRIHRGLPGTLITLERKSWKTADRGGALSVYIDLAGMSSLDLDERECL